jgi:hypothetical protein
MVNKEYHKEYYLKNREKIINRAKQYYLGHKDHIKEYYKVYAKKKREEKLNGQKTD